MHFPLFQMNCPVSRCMYFFSNERLTSTTHAVTYWTSRSSGRCVQMSTGHSLADDTQTQWVSMSVETASHSVLQGLIRSRAPAHGELRLRGWLTDGAGQVTDEPETLLTQQFPLPPQHDYLPELPKRSRHESNLSGFSLLDLEMTLERAEKQPDPS